MLVGGDVYLGRAAPALLAGRNATEQHSMHLHGHHFWVSRALRLPAIDVDLDLARWL